MSNEGETPSYIPYLIGKVTTHIAVDGAGLSTLYVIWMNTTSLSLLAGDFDLEVRRHTCKHYNKEARSIAHPTALWSLRFSGERGSVVTEMLNHSICHTETKV